MAKVPYPWTRKVETAGKSGGLVETSSASILLPLGRASLYEVRLSGSRNEAQ